MAVRYLDSDPAATDATAPGSMPPRSSDDGIPRSRPEGFALTNIDGGPGTMATPVWRDGNVALRTARRPNSRISSTMRAERCGSARAIRTMSS